jgi:hypothetical protein
MTLLARDKRCEKCGQTFECGGLLGCWCWSVKLDAATLASLKSQYGDCLCQACLAQIAEDLQRQTRVTDKSLTVR